MSGSRRSRPQCRSRCCATPWPSGSGRLVAALPPIPHEIARGGRWGQRTTLRTLSCSRSHACAMTTTSARSVRAAARRALAPWPEAGSAAASHASSGQSTIKSPCVRRTSGPITSYQVSFIGIGGPPQVWDEVRLPARQFLRGEFDGNGPPHQPHRRKQATPRAKIVLFLRGDVLGGDKDVLGF